MTNYEFIKSLEGTTLGAILSCLNLVKVYSKEEIGDIALHSITCNRCKLYEKEGCTCHRRTAECCETIMKWLDSPVDDIIVLSKKG